MKRVPRLLPSFTVACALATPLLTLSVAYGQDAPATAPAAAVVAAPAAAPANKELLQSAEDFWHYASIARFPLAKAEADKIIANTSAAPMEVLNAFAAVVDLRNQRVPAERKVELYERLLAWQAVPELKEASVSLIGIFNKAKRSRAAEGAFIEQNIQRLGENRRAYLLAMDQIKESGELAVPIMLSYLRESARKELHVPIRTALHDLGYRALNPLLAATESQDANTLVWVVASLGDLGYDIAVPYLVRLVKSPQTPDTVKSAATQALLRLNVSNPQALDPAQLFYDLAEKFYYEKSAVAPAKGASQAFMWYMGQNGLGKKDVPAATFNEDMALRCCEYALKLDKARGDALSLWLAAGYQRELQLVEGAVDPTWDEKHPDTHFYAVDSGTRHLNPVLARALRDHNAPLALKAIRSLQQIVGASNLFSGDQSMPILDAMRYPDRQVRFEAALTIAQSLPDKAFSSQELVVPILAEALAQTGKAGIMVLASSQDELNQRVDLVGKAGAYNVKGGVGADAAIAASSALDGVDVILMQEKGGEQIDRMMAQTRENNRLERAAKLIIVTSKVASPYAAIALTNPLITVTDATEGPALAAAIEDARKRAAGLPLDEKIATGYALRSADVLGKLAISRGQVLDLSIAQNALLAAMHDPRAEVAKAADLVVGRLNLKVAQGSLLAKGLDEKMADELKVSAFKNLAVNAKAFGNQIDPSQIAVLTKFVQDAQIPEVRSAAAEALGSLNIQSDQANTLILNQAKI